MPVTQEDIEKCVAILRRHGATRIVLFGSAVDSPETARDLDLACDGIEGWEFFLVGGEIEEALGISVDLVPLSPPSDFTKHIEKWGRVIYDSGKVAEMNGERTA